MNYEIFAPLQKTIKHATLTQLKFQKNARCWELEEKIKVLELEFMLTSEIKDPEGWANIQTRLGVLYKLFMELNKRVRFG